MSILLAALVLLGAAQSPEEWHHYAHDAGGARFSPLTQINQANVARLERAWTYRTGDVADGSTHYAECTPLMVEGVLYIITPFSRLIAVDAFTGEERWRFTPDPPLDIAETGGGGLASRGVAFWKEGNQKRIFLPVRDGRVYSIDPETHLPDANFGKDGHIDLRSGLTGGGKFLFLSSPPALYKNVLLQPYGISDTSSERLDYVPLRAFDARTGALLWTFNTVPQPGELGHETWGGDSWRNRAGCNPWAPISVDEARGSFYVPIGAPNADKFGGDRPGDNLFGNSLVALDALTGKRLWHFQAVHHDLWDYDLPAQPNLFETKRGSEVIPAVAALGKTGFVYVFNRVTGAPLFPIEERAVPQSDFPLEKASPTQPFPTRPPAFVRQRMDLQDLNRLGADDAEKSFAGLRSEGLFTPPSTQGTVVLPGQHGGGNWSGAAVTPSGELYICATELPYISTVRAGEGPYGATPSAKQFRTADNFPAVSPPWGTLSKIDLNRGELIWQRPLGEFAELTAKGIPPTGTTNFGGCTVTAGGLVLAAGTMDAKFRVFDAQSGDVLFESSLEAAAYSAPITYAGNDGAQYITLFAGGGGKYQSAHGDYLIAFRLGEGATPLP